MLNASEEGRLDVQLTVKKMNSSHDAPVMFSIIKISI